MKKTNFETVRGQVMLFITATLTTINYKQPTFLPEVNALQFKTLTETIQNNLKEILPK